MANSADSDQLASSEGYWSGSTMFAKAGHIQVQQGIGLNNSSGQFWPNCLSILLLKQDLESVQMVMLH